MSNIQPLSVFLSERLTAVAVEIHAVVQKTIAGYQAEVLRSKEEIQRLRMLLKLQRADPQLLTLPAVDIRPALVEHERKCLGQTDSEPLPIKWKQEPSLSSSEDHGQIEELQSDIKQFVMFSPLFDKSGHEQEGPAHSLHLYQAPVEENGEMDSLPSNSYEQVETGSDGEGYGESEPTTSNYCFAAEAVSFDGMGNGEQRSLHTTERVRKSMQWSQLKSTGQGHFKVAGPSCKVCGRSFNKMGSLMKHVQTHTGEEEHVCGVCGERFGSTERVTDHLETHNGAQFCHVCGKSFSKSTKMNRHMRTHTGEKPYQCHQCGKVFNQSGNLQLHMRSHTGEKPYQCSVCDKCFITSCHLTGHMRTHTGEKPFVCTVCEKCFSDRSTLSKHLTVHTKDHTTVRTNL
uniref:C2H2-type domain-containing protein n=1 Tax=Esox lucius TaxID=8010 RepID=A0A6Q2YYD8_ESOLU